MSSPAITRPTLKRGDRGIVVCDLQKALGIESDGVFAEVTELAVREFQAHHGLNVTGEADEATNAKLFSGPDFRAIAVRLADPVQDSRNSDEPEELMKF